MENFKGFPVGHIDEIEVSKLRLDPFNPRLPQRLHQADVSDREILNWMLDDASLVHLMASIASNGFFPGEPIVALQEESTFIVVEGNRRLAAIKLLTNPSLASESPKTVFELSEKAKDYGTIPWKLPVYVVSKRDEVDNYIAFRHVTGIKSWPILSKARYSYYLFGKKKFYPEIFKDIASEIGSYAKHIRRYVQGYDLYLLAEKNEFFGVASVAEENFPLSLLTDSFDLPNIARLIRFNPNQALPSQEIDLENFELLFRWLYEIDPETKSTRLGESRDITLLNKVLGADKAKEKFLDGSSLKEAAEFTTAAEESLQEALKQARFWLRDANGYVTKVENVSDDDMKLSEQVLKMAEKIDFDLRYIKRKDEKVDFDF